MNKHSDYVLWLASWYPNKVYPSEGDFVQRQAQAVSKFEKIILIYVCQAGIEIPIDKNENIVSEKENLKEVFVYFKTPKTGVRWLDVALYNIRYQRTYRQTISHYFRENGLPKLVHVHIPMKAGTIALWVRRKWKTNFFVTEHSAHYGGISADDFSSKSFLYKRICGRVFRAASKVINVSQAMATTLMNTFNVPEVKVIPNTVDTDLFSYQQIPSGIFRFIHVSSLVDEHKNVQGILNAVKILSRNRDDFKLIVVGPFSQSLVESANQLGIDQLIEFVGEISYRQVSKQIKNSSAFVLFSWYENSPCVIAESLCCGVPVITSNVGGVAEMVNPTNGLLVAAGKETELANAMSAVMERYEFFDREAISQSAMQKFSFDAIGYQLSNLYNASLATKTKKDVS